MSGERLRLEAEFRDRGVSAGIRKISNELKEVRRTPGMEAAQEWVEKFHEKARGFVTDGGGVAGAMTAMGVGGLTAAASLVELVAHFKELGERTLAMKELGRETGLTTGQIIAMNKAAAQFGVGPEKMQAALNQLKSQMPEFLANQGKLWEEIHGRFPKLSDQLKADKGDTEKQIEDIFKIAQQPKLQQNPQLQKQFLEMFFGNGDEMEKLFAKGPGAFLKALQEQNRDAPDTTLLEKQAEGFAKATREFNEALENLETKAGPTIIGGMSEILGEFNVLFKNLDRIEAWWENRSTKQKFDDVAKVVDDQLNLTPKQKYDRYHDAGMFAPPKDLADAQQRMQSYIQQRNSLQAGLDQDKQNNPVGFAARHADDISALRDLNEALLKLRDEIQTLSTHPEKMSYSGRGLGGGSGFQRASFGGIDGDDSPFAAAVKAGVVAGFHELFAERTGAAAGSGGGAGSGFQQAMWEDGSGTGGGTGGGFGSGAGSRPGRRRGGASGAPRGRRGFGDGGSGPFNAREPEAAGTYRPNYKLSAADLDSGVVNRIAGEVSTHDGAGVDAVINNMMNRVGSKGWGPSQNLLAVATAKGQYAGYRHANQKEAAFIRSRIEAIASGGVEDNTHGANSYRAEGYYRNTKGRGRGYWADSAEIGPDVAGNRYGFVKGVPNGPYAPYSDSAVARRRMNLQDVSPKLSQPAPTATGSIRADIHLHDRGGAVKKTGVQSTGMVTARVNHWPQMVQPSVDA